MKVFLTVYAVLARASSAFGGVAVARPETLDRAGTVVPNEFYAQVYASQAIPLRAAGATALLARPETASGWLLTLGAAQLGDAAIGVRNRGGAWSRRPD